MPKFEVVNPGWEWSDRYTFSPAVRKGNLLFISGMTGTDESGRLVGPDIASQTRQIYRKLDQILKAAGSSFDDVVKTTEFITTTERYRETAAVRREFMKNGFSAATGVIIKGILRDGALIEIDAIAVLDEPRRPAARARKRAPARKAAAEKGRARKSAAKRAPARKRAAKRTAAKKTARKAPARKAPARKAPARKRAARR